jgi:putative transposase
LTATVRAAGLSIAKTASAGQVVDLSVRIHRQLAIENLALRHQLSVYKRTMMRPKLRTTDRLFWIGLARIWAGWRQSLVIVTPDTVLRWRRRRFRKYWTQLSGGSTGGRPPVDAEIRALVTRMATANPLWGAPRIHGELLKIGIEVAERTVSRLMPRRRPQPSQTWRTFLANHARELVSIDFFTVPTARLRVLFVLVVLAHHRRRVVHFEVTEHPTRRLDCPADRGRVPGRLRASLSPARP